MFAAVFADDCWVAKRIGADRERKCDSLRSAFGAELTDRRTKQKWTQQRLADVLGYDITYIGQIERGEKSPTLDTLASIAGAFEVQLSSLIRAAERRLSIRRTRIEGN